MKEFVVADSIPGFPPSNAPSEVAPHDDEGEPKVPDVLSILPMRNFVLFPGTVAPLNIGRPESIRLMEDTLPGSKFVGVMAQRDATKDRSTPEDLYTMKPNRPRP